MLLNMVSPTTVGLAVGLIALIIASWCDIKTREVPDWLNYSLIAFALASAVTLSIYHNYSHIFFESLLGAGFGVLIGLAMFYTGQWGGGDAKLIIGIAALIGFSVSDISKSSMYFLVFLVNILLVGSLYGLGYSFVKAIINYKLFKPAIEEKLRSKTALIIRIILLVLGIGAFIFLVASRSIESAVLFGLALAFFLFFYLWAFVSTVEQVCMIKKTPVSKLTEGDWISGNVMKGKKIILQPQKTGLTLEDIALLKKKKIKEVLVKIGVPFVPSFLIAYILTFAVGNWMAYLM